MFATLHRHRSIGNWLWTCLLVSGLTACGPAETKTKDTTKESEADAAADATASADVQDTGSNDTQLGNDSLGGDAKDATAEDSATAEDTTTAEDADVPPAPGSIGAPCSSPTDCDSAICLETPDGQRCSKFCGDGGCPSGWACEGQKGGADATFFCIPVGGLTCRPCTSDTECEASGNAGARCVDYGDVGGFCGVACKDDGGCGAGQACHEVASVQGGAKSKQCVQAGTAPDTLGVCACSPYAKDKGLQTTCYVTAGDAVALKRCKGTRACGSEGLGACEPLQGAAAVCQEAQCLDPKTGTPVADGTACDDGRVCTEGDVCQQGICKAGKQTCACEPGFLDCPAPTGDEASNKCLGAPYCKAQPSGTAKPFACVPNPAGTKVCDASLDDACTKNACAPLAGSCTVTATERTEEICDLPPAKDGEPNGCRRQVLPSSATSKPAAACDDGLPCSPGDACNDGVCKPTSLVACACQNDVDCKDDGDLCNGTPYCDKTGTDGGGYPLWQCKTNPATIVTCDDSKDGNCQQTTCEPNSGTCSKVVKPEFSPCDDGVACTKGDVCSKDGTCQPGTWTCCKSDSDCASEEDGNLCNGTLFCNLASGKCEDNPATKVTCPSVDDTECLHNLCAPKTGQCGFVAVNVGGTCSDGNACSDLDTCDTKGSCTPGKDTCPCKVDADCAQYDDGDLCNGTLYCNPIAGPDGTGRCRPNPKTVVVCKTVDDTACSRNRCEPKTGQCGVVQLPANVTCDADGTACTANDSCDGKGSCVAGTVVCVCQSDADCAAKEDGDLCNGTLFCDKSGKEPACKLNPATVKSCPSVDDTACQKNVCQPKTGACVVQAMSVEVACNDGESCTGSDHCDGKGACVAGPVETCGCLFDTHCATFDDGDVCNGAYVCSNKTCVFNGKALSCDDGNPCTTDSCDPKTGCKATTVPSCVPCSSQEDCFDSNDCTVEVCASGQCFWEASSGACSDLSLCTVGDFCDTKVCKAGKVQDCDDKDVCTNDSCSPSKGCISVPNTATCDDGDACTSGDVCGNGSCKGPTAVSCSDGKTCTVDTCDKQKGCQYAAASNGLSCPEAYFGTCVQGICVEAPCGPGYEQVEVDDNGSKVKQCAAWGPVWGATTPKLVSLEPVSGEKVVEDSVSKLMWNPNTSSIDMEFATAANTCATMVHAGYKDWRLPTAAELWRLIDHAIPGSSSTPMIDTTMFPGFPAKSLWSTNGYGSSTTSRWSLDFSSGGCYADVVEPVPPDVAELNRALCVRSTGKLQPGGPRYLVDAAAGVVTDTWQKIQWQRTVESTTQDWDKGKFLCDSLDFAGKTDWRLPTVRELYGIIDLHNHKPSLDGQAFLNADIDAYTLSSTVSTASSKEFYAVRLLNATASRRDKVSQPGLVRCVRDLTL